jgi:protein gp37
LNNIPLPAREAVRRQHWIQPSIESLEIASKVFDDRRFHAPSEFVAIEFQKEGLTMEMDLTAMEEAVVYGDTKKAVLLDSS